MTTKVLLFGGSGQLGTSIQKLWHDPYEIYAPSSDEINVCNSGQINKTIDLMRPEIVINCAAATNVDKCEEDATLAYAINTGAPLAMAMAAKKIDSYFVHLSTDYVFSNIYLAPHKEFDFTTNPLSVYGKSKLHGERVVAGATDALIVRTSGLYGLIPSRAKGSFIDFVIQCVERGFTVKAIGDRFASPTFADHLALGLKHLVTNRHTGLYHVANQGDASWYEFALEICNQLGRDPTLIVPTRHEDIKTIATRPQYSSLDCKKLNITGYTMPTWVEGIKDYLKQL